MRVFLLIAIAMGSVAEIHAQESSRQTLTVGMPRDWPPYYGIDGDEHPTGFAVEIMSAVARRADVDLDYRIFDDFPAVIAALRSGKIDVIPNFGITAQRDREFDFSSPLEVFDVTLFVRSDTSGVSRLADLGGRRVGVVESNVGVDVVAGHPDIKAVVYKDIRTGLYELLAGRVDGLVYPRPIVLALARSAGLEDDIEAIGPSLREVKRGVAVRDGDPLMQRIEPAVTDLAGSPEYTRIYERWFGSAPPLWTPARVAALAGAGLMLILFVYVWSRRRWRRRHDDAVQRRQRAEDERKATQGRLRGLLDQASDGIFIASPEGVFTEVNRRGCEMTGYSRDEIIGAPLAKLLAPGELEGRPLELAELELGKVKLSERTFLRADGTTFPGEISATLLADGSYQGILRDVSERHAAEEAIRARDAQLQQAQKMEAIGRLAGGIAHDFNNLLTIIMGEGAVLAKKIDGHPRELLDGIMDAASRAADLTRQLLAYSRQQVIQPELVDVCRALKQSEGLLRSIAGDSVVLKLETSEEPCVVRVAPTHLEQIFMNLAVNARDAMPKGGELLFRCAVRADGENDPGRVVIDIADTGHGMDEQTRAHVFEPFYTTKEVGKGTGLGLATVYSIVEQSGGQLGVDSAPGEGTKFRIELPRQTAAAAEEPVEPRRRPESGASRGAILVVEDEPGVRRLAARILEEDGYRVDAADAGGRALELLEAGLAVDAVVTDVVMPGMDGVELAARLRDLRPGLAVLFMSGHARDSLDQTLAEPDRAFLAKPFTPDELLESVASLLHRARREDAD